MSLSTEICGIQMKNPLILASGIMGVTKASIKNVADNGAGAVTIKSISREARKGHKNPILISYSAGLMNAVGYSNPGIDEAKKEFSGLKEVGVPVIASIIGKNADEFAFMAKEFLSDEFAAVEIPLSCPHTPGYGTLAGQSTPEATLEIANAVSKNTKLPVFVKLSPNTQQIGEIAKAAERGGAAGITAVNTLGPGMKIDTAMAKPILDFKVGGISGPALHPIAVRCVFDIFSSVKIPIIGTGGVTTGDDAIQMIMAGASAVGLGTGIYYRGIDVFAKVSSEIAGFMEKEGYSSIREMVGIVHKP